MITLNPGLTMTDGLIIAAGGLVGMLLCGFRGFRAWTSSPEAWALDHQLHRPRNWTRCPILRAQCRDRDLHPRRYLWQDRILAVVGVLFCGLFLLIGMQVVLGKW